MSLTAAVRQVMASISVVIGFGLEGTTAMFSCVGMDTFLKRLIFWMALPPCLVGIILLASLVHLLHLRRPLHELGATALPHIVRVLFLLYPFMANVSFAAFSCYEELDDGSRYLIEDVTLDCNSDR